jgi:NADH-quinone oxidoreductase subunit J
MFFSLLIAGTGAIVTILSLVNYPFRITASVPLDVDMRLIGMQLMSTGVNGYALPFEVISVLLLAAMIGAIVIAKKGR